MPIPSTRTRLVSWCLQLLAAGILGQTLFFKLSGAAESRAIFTALSAEPFGRYATAALELAAVVLLVSRRPVLGALLTLALMGGAIASHLLVLGVEVAGDGGQLFALAVVSAAAGAAVAWIRRAELPFPRRARAA